jgi:hypothetical protein
VDSRLLGRIEGPTLNHARRIELTKIGGVLMDEPILLLDPDDGLATELNNRIIHRERADAHLVNRVSSR